MSKKSDNLSRIRAKRFVVISTTDLIGESLQEIMARSTSLKRKRAAFVELGVCERPTQVIMSIEFKRLIDSILKVKLEVTK
jgi:hypothetical protein